MTCIATELEVAINSRSRTSSNAWRGRARGADPRAAFTSEHIAAIHGVEQAGDSIALVLEYGQ